jgi:hypothetical protein
MPSSPSPQTIDTSTTLAFEQSAWKMLAISAASLAVTALSAFFVFGTGDTALAFVGWIGLVFFGLCTGFLLWRTFAAKGPALVLSPAGLHDVRVSAHLIPWPSVRRMYTWSYEGQRILIVDIDPQVEASIGLTRIASWTRAPNRAMGADGLAVTAQGLTLSYDRLYQLACAYATAHGSPLIAP